MFNFTLKNKNAFITGASSGIGQATANLFFRLGANLLITGRNEIDLINTVSLCEKNRDNPNQKSVIFVADLSKENEVIKLSEKALSEFSQVDILVNNAGMLIYDTIENVDMAQFDAIMNVNLRAAIQLTNLLTSSLIKAKGSVVNVSSINGIRSFPRLMSYCIGKAAMDQFTKCAALDLGAKGVRVNAVNPGLIMTNIHKRAGMDETTYQNFLERAQFTHPLGRYGDALEVAYSIAFLASSAASFTTGATFPVDGGRFLLCPR